MTQPMRRHVCAALILAITGLAALPAEAGQRSRSRSSVNAGGRQRNTNMNRNTSVNRNTNINRNDNVNINSRRDVDIDIDVDHRGGYYGGCCYHPVATAAAVTAAAVVTAAVVGSVVYSLPPACSTVIVNGFAYQQCGSTWYQPRMSGSSVTYVVVAPLR